MTKARYHAAEKITTTGFSKRYSNSAVPSTTLKLFFENVQHFCMNLCKQSRRAPLTIVEGCPTSCRAASYKLSDARNFSRSCGDSISAINSAINSSRLCAFLAARSTITFANGPTYEANDFLAFSSNAGSKAPGEGTVPRVAGTPVLTLIPAGTAGEPNSLKQAR